MEKLCYACQQTKPSTEFYTSPQTKDGLMVYCKVCHKAKIKEGREKRIAKTTPVKPPPGTLKVCRTCRQTKPIEEFGNNRTNADGLNHACKPCARAFVTASRKKNPEGHRASSKRWRLANLDRHADNNLRYTRGVPNGTYARLLTEQEGKCAICTNPPGARRFHLDHCHDTGKIRGLLCSKCNTGIGQLNHDVNILQAAIRYLGP